MHSVTGEAPHWPWVNFTKTLVAPVLSRESKRCRISYSQVCLGVRIHILRSVDKCIRSCLLADRHSGMHACQSCKLNGEPILCLFSNRGSSCGSCKIGGSSTAARQGCFPPNISFESVEGACKLLSRRPQHRRPSARGRQGKIPGQ